MNAAEPAIVELTEYQPALLPHDQVPAEVGELLWRKHGRQVAVEFPSPKTGGQWQLTSQGWVGHIPLTPERHFVLRSKVELGNLFRMLEYAYHLRLQFLSGMTGCGSLAEFYERLANVLARRILDRGRKGFYRTYLTETDSLPYVRGQLDVRRLVQIPWDVKLQCHYQEHSADVEENQILAWTLFVIAHNNACSERVLPTVRRAYRLLQGVVTLSPFGSLACVGRLYNRLNEDYEPLHGLCRFFLEHSGPTHLMGSHTMLPFIVNMARLFELFVAEWLKEHLPKGLEVKAQETISMGEAGTLQFKVDLVLRETTTGLVRCVLDTKYKTPETPGTEDVAQVVAYAEAKGCGEAVLIYPSSLKSPLDVKVGDIRVRSLTFSIHEDLDQAGQVLLDSLPAW